jgi:phenylalanyl-tRNA synthetase alpha chain
VRTAHRYEADLAMTFNERQLEELQAQALAEIAAAKSADALEQLRVQYLGRKGRLTQILRGLKDIAPQDRPKFGEKANLLKEMVEQAISKKLNDLRGKVPLETSITAETETSDVSLEIKKGIKRLRRIEKEIKVPGIPSEVEFGIPTIFPIVYRKPGPPEILRTDDVTLPGRRQPLGHLHPLNRIMSEICDIFQRLGFEAVEGPEVELDWYNFEALNIPPDHPARDMQDTFYFNDKVLLRTHTSPMQIRVMEKRRPPVRIIAPGKVYRRDSDMTHSPMFHQVEGLLVDKNVTFADLKGVLTAFVHQLFGPEVSLRFRPSYFPFTEPSAEIDIACVICRGEGCRVCKITGWLEVLGAGMVHPNVFEAVGYDPEEYTGFAFGLGVERFAMLKYGIDDIRLFFDNDLRFLRQF